MAEAQKYTTEDLVRLYSPASIDTQTETPVRYVMYLHKSTEGKERQEKSIQDQEAECLGLASKMELRVVNTIREEKSAKESGKRQLFNQMVQD